MNATVRSNSFFFSVHAETRIAQRSIQANCIDLLLLHGTSCNAGGGCESYILFSQTIRNLQMDGYSMELLNSAAKLRAIVSEDGTVVTCYHVRSDMRRCSNKKNRSRRGRDVARIQ